MESEQKYLLKIAGKKIIKWPESEFIRVREKYHKLVIDLGTGDGKHVLRWARNNPQDFVLGIDSHAGLLTKTSLKTTQAISKGGCPNAAFIQCAAENLSPLLRGVDSIHILMPWGSLLREILPYNGQHSLVLEGIRNISRPGTELIVVLNLHAWDPKVPEVGEIPLPNKKFLTTTLAEEYRRYGIEIRSAGEIDEDIISNYVTSWTRKLASSREQLSVLALRGTL